MIHMSNIVLRREERTILDQVDLHVNKGEHWVILGRNGSGKTTLLEMMTGYMFPTSGTVDVLGNRYGRCDVRDVRLKIGYMSQSLVEKLALGDPVWEVVATGEYAFLRFYQDIPQEVQDKARGLLQSFGIGHMADQPLGTLSQGERKKALLARALMADPSLLIMDEACSGLDLYEREKLLGQLNTLAERNLSVVYVTHHIEEIIPLFTHVALIDEGKIVAAGEKEHVLRGDVLSRAYGLPVEVEWKHGRPWVSVAVQDGGQ